MTTTKGTAERDTAINALIDLAEAYSLEFEYAKYQYDDEHDTYEVIFRGVSLADQKNSFVWNCTPGRGGSYIDALHAYARKIDHSRWMDIRDGNGPRSKHIARVRSPRLIPRKATKRRFKTGEFCNVPGHPD